MTMPCRLLLAAIAACLPFAAGADAPVRADAPDHRSMPNGCPSPTTPSMP
ncbi:hypothetical protein [Rhodanobacter lindaniclasticus]